MLLKQLLNYHLTSICETQFVLVANAYDIISL